MEELTRGRDLTEDEMMELMKNEMGEESGKQQEEETKDTADTMKHILTSKKKNIKTNQDDVKDMLDQRLDDKAKAKMQEMLEAGVPLKEALEQFGRQGESAEQEMTEIQKKM